MVQKYSIVLYCFLLDFVFSCNAQSQANAKGEQSAAPAVVPDPGVPVIHVFVALCDNRYQGIVPVPSKIGNGQDPRNNLYWGCAYGISTFFKKSPEWKLVRQYQPDSIRLERLVFRHTSRNYYLVADAYDGKYIKTCTYDFLNSCAGKEPDTLMAGGKAIGIKGNARLLCYIGHDGLMDFSLDETFVHAGGSPKDAMILACYSQKYFTPYLKQTGADPLLWSAGLMSPEAYTLHDAIHAYVEEEGKPAIRRKAAAAYAKYQKCSERAAMNMLRSGYE